jgi:predicted O-methyltransferase YrrM
VSDPAWSAVDEYLAGHLLSDDEALTAALANNKAQGLPPIDVSAVQGKLLHLLARMAGARRVLEVGTLGGFSTIWLARALPEGGKVVTLELEARNAKVARENVDRAAVGDKVEILVGPAKDSLAAMQPGDPFDFVFIDADKQSNAHYVQEAIRLGRPGTTIIVDNVVRDGGVIDAGSTNAQIVGTRRMFELLAKEGRLDATAIQMVGAKGWDGFVLALVL